MLVTAPGLHTAEAAVQARTTNAKNARTPNHMITELASESSVSLAGSASTARTVNVSFKQMGAYYPLQLRGIRGTSGVTFSVRADQVVTRAKLKINYAYSPALIPELSHINVLVNEQVAATIAVPREQAGKNLQREIDIPPRLITEFNRLNIELIGHYTRDCEDPAHTSLWANVGNDSVLDLTMAHVAQVNDLATLPQPFFDRRDVIPLSLPFVFAGAPTAATLESAGVISSWLGALSGRLGARFSTLQGQLPTQGNAVVFAVGNQPLPGGLASQNLKGPTVAIAPNPNDPNAKVLLVMGRDAQELRTAATAVATGSPLLSGQLATITSLTQLQPRKPYDAPNWLASDRPVKFGELARDDSLQVSGYSPDMIRVNVHFPPDLFAWRSKGIPVDLRYRYTPRPYVDESTLNISANQQFLRSLPLLALTHDAPSGGLAVDKLLSGSELIPAREQFHIPLHKLSPQTQLQFLYFHDVVKEGSCKDVILDNNRGTVEPDSTIDISGFSHFLAMPNLAAFSSSGFPFTRMADLSETAVVLAEKATPADHAQYLDLMGLFGKFTGTPATAVTVAHPRQLDALADKDVLWMGTSASGASIPEWGKASPISVQPGARSYTVSDFAQRLFNWWNPVQREPDVSSRTQLGFQSDGQDGVIAGFESPFSARRSVVQLASNTPEGMTRVLDALMDPEVAKDIQGSVAVVRGKQVSSVVADQTYYVGQLNPITWAQWYLSRSPFVLLTLGLFSAFVLGVLLYVVLRARARARLNSQF